MAATIIFPVDLTQKVLSVTWPVGALNVLVNVPSLYLVIPKLPASGIQNKRGSLQTKDYFKRPGFVYRTVPPTILAHEILNFSSVGLHAGKICCYNREFSGVTPLTF